MREAVSASGLPAAALALMSTEACSRRAASGAHSLRHVIAHAYDHLDVSRVHRAAREGPRDLEAFLSALADRL